MARDFAKSGAKRKTPAKKSGAKKAPRKKAAAKTASPGAPTALVFIAGFASGLFVGFLIYLSGVVPKTFSTEANSPVEAETKVEVVEEKPEKKIDFEFYKMLQEQEVEVEPVVPAEDRATTDKKYIYMLQVASFRSLPDADRLKASLILEHGMTVNIHTVSGDNGTWHKVIAGPFNTRSKAASARGILAQEGFDSMEFKRPVQ